MSVIHGYLNLLFGGEPAVFSSQYSVDESVARLASAVVSNPFRTLFQPALVGRVSAGRVSVRYHRPFVRNSWKPVFDGHFIERNGRVALEGRFTTHAAVKVFGALWLAVVALFMVVGVAIAISGTNGGSPVSLPARLLLLLMPVAPLLFFTAMTYVGRAMGRRDADFIAAEINRVLGGNSASKAPVWRETQDG